MLHELSEFVIFPCFASDWCMLWFGIYRLADVDYYSGTPYDMFEHLDCDQVDLI
jgi:hypothetical protein